MELDIFGSNQSSRVNSVMTQISATRCNRLENETFASIGNVLVNHFLNNDNFPY